MEGPADRATPIRKNPQSAALLTVSGLVQGVGYRAWTVRQAQRLGLAGWVRNMPSGEVETLAQGDKKSLDAFVEALNSGPPYSRVDRVTVQTVQLANLSGFNVVY
jgi:acylphosphatase